MTNNNLNRLNQYNKVNKIILHNLILVNHDNFLNNNHIHQVMEKESERK